MTTLCLAGEARNSGLAISICLEVADALRHVANVLHRLLTCKPAWIVRSDHAGSRDKGLDIILSSSWQRTLNQAACS